MKVLIINGSPRVGGNTSVALNEMVKVFDAEGVETEEHYEFLKKIGCEKVQGYFFGKPMPLEETMSNCKALGLGLETRSWQKYYDKIGTVNFTTDRPLALYEFDGEKFQLLHMNRQFLDVLKDAGTENMIITDFITISCTA